MNDADGTRADAWALQVNCGPEGFPELCQQDLARRLCRHDCHSYSSQPVYTLSAGGRDALSFDAPLPTQCGGDLGGD